MTPDVNTIPTDLIERVDVVTGGNSAVYGSDAIAGVVNFILKDDYEGIQLRGQGGVSKYGDAGSYFISGLWGTNFADGRGNIAVNAEYARQEQYFGAGRPYIASQDAFLVVDSDPAGAPNGSDGNPDRLFFRDIRSASLTNTGVVRFGGTTLATAAARTRWASVYPCVFIFQPDGTLVPATGERVGVTTGSFIGGNSENFRGGTAVPDVAAARPLQRQPARPLRRRRMRSRRSSKRNIRAPTASAPAAPARHSPRARPSAIPFAVLRPAAEPRADSASTTRS